MGTSDSTGRVQSPASNSKPSREQQFAQDQQKAILFVDELLQGGIIGSFQHFFLKGIVTLFTPDDPKKDFGGGWTDEVLSRANLAVRRLYAHERAYDRAETFIHRARTCFPATSDALTGPSMKARKFLRNDVVSPLEAIVYIFISARDKPELLETF